MNECMYVFSIYMDTKAGNGMALMTAKLIDNIAAKLINLQTEAQKKQKQFIDTCIHVYLLCVEWHVCMYVCMYV